MTCANVHKRMGTCVLFGIAKFSLYKGLSIVYNIIIEDYTITHYKKWKKKRYLKLFFTVKIHNTRPVGKPKKWTELARGMLYRV
jgi:hypothetical protein